MDMADLLILQDFGNLSFYLQELLNLTNSNSVLDVGCAKGFMLYDIHRLIPGINIRGIDISEYAIDKAKEEIKEFLQVGDASLLPFEDNSYDVVISINTVHNLDEQDCAKALQEIERVSKGKSFITVDAYRNNEEKDRMLKWNLTAKTIKHVDEWMSSSKRLVTLEITTGLFHNLKTKAAVLVQVKRTFKSYRTYNSFIRKGASLSGYGMEWNLP